MKLGMEIMRVIQFMKEHFVVVILMVRCVSGAERERVSSNKTFLWK